MNKNDKIEQFSRLAQRDPAGAFTQFTENKYTMDADTAIAMGHVGLVKLTGTSRDNNARAFGFLKQTMWLIERQVEFIGLEDETAQFAVNLLKDAAKLATAWGAMDKLQGVNVSNAIQDYKSKLGLHGHEPA